MKQAKIPYIIIYALANIAALSAGAVIALILLWLMATGGDYSVGGPGVMACGNIFDNYNPLLVMFIQWSVGAGLTLVLSLAVRRYVARRLDQVVLK